jgi:hypothetical protein
MIEDALRGARVDERVIDDENGVVRSMAMQARVLSDR